MKRLPVYGNVTHSGGEKISGLISFMPAQGRPGPAAVASLVEGRYRFDASDGPTAGPHRVVISRKVSKGQLQKQADSPGQAGPGRQSGAAQGPKTEWTRSADVPAKGPYEFNFQVD